MRRNRGLYMRRETEGVSAGAGDDRFGVASEADAQEVIGRFRDSAGGRTGNAAGYRVSPTQRRADRLLPLVQGSYYLVSGIWPLVHMRSFEAVTGRKTDRWLVRTVGVLAAAIGAGLVRSALAGQTPSSETKTIANLAAAGFVAIEVPTVARGTIPLIYLADAAVECAFLAAGAWSQGANRRPGERLDRLVAREAQEEGTHY